MVVVLERVISKVGLWALQREWKSCLGNEVLQRSKVNIPQLTTLCEILRCTWMHFDFGNVESKHSLDPASRHCSSVKVHHGGSLLSDCCCGIQDFCRDNGLIT